MKQILILILLVWAFIHLKAESNNLFYGKKALAEKNYNQALNYFYKEIKSNPKNCEAYFYTGITFEKMNQKENSISYFLSVTKMYCDPKLKEQSYWKVLNYYKYLEDWDNLYLIAKSFLQFKPNSEVEKYYKLAQEKKDPNKTKVLELLSIAEQNEKNNQLVEAAKKYKEVFLITKEIEYLLKSAIIYKQAKIDEEAFQTFLEILEYQPNHWYANYQSGIYYYYYGFPKKCIEHLDKAKNYNTKPEKNFIYYFHLVQAFCNLNSENLEEFKTHYLFLKQFNYKKEESYFVLELFYEFFNHSNLNLNINRDISKREEIVILMLLDNFYKKDIEKIYKVFLSNPFDDSKFIRWSNFINQLLITLFVEYRNDQEKRKELVKITENQNFSKIIKKPYQNLIVNEFLKDLPDSVQINLDSKFIETLKKIENFNRLNLILSYIYFLENNKEKFKENLHNIKGEELAFIYFLHFILNIYDLNFEQAYINLKKSIELDSNFKEIVKKENSIKTIVQENRKLSELIGLEENP